MKAIIKDRQIVGSIIKGKDIKIRKQPAPAQLYQVDWYSDGMPQTYKAGKSKVRQYMANLTYAALTDKTISDIRLFRVVSECGKSRLEIIEGGKL